MDKMNVTQEELNEAVEVAEEVVKNKDLLKICKYGGVAVGAAAVGGAVVYGVYKAGKYIKCKVDGKLKKNDEPVEEVYSEEE